MPDDAARGSFRIRTLYGRDLKVDVHGGALRLKVYPEPVLKPNGRQKSQPALLIDRLSFVAAAELREALTALIERGQP